MPFAPTKWLTQIFVDCNRFNKGKINEVRIEWTLKSIMQEQKAYGQKNQIDRDNSINSSKYSHK